MIQRFHILFLIFFLFIFSCRVSQRSKPTNFSNTYKKDKTGFEGKFKVFHTNDIKSKIFFLFQSQELLHTRTSSTENFMYKLEIRYNLYQNFERKIIADSSKIYISNYSDPNINKEIIGHFEIIDSIKTKYMLEIISKDVFRNQEFTTYIEIDRNNIQDSYNYLLLKNDRVFFNRFFYVGDTVSVVSRYKNPTYFINYFYKNFPPAIPPFSFSEEVNFKFDIDSLYTLESVDTSFQIILDKIGIYYIRTDTSKQDGLALLCFEENTFPQVNDYKELIEPLRYITSKKEFTDMVTGDTRYMFEQFWLNITGNNYDRSRELIKEYYHRVYMSNILFTSYTEGWKSDRGMIYMVFGPPSIVYKSSDVENWVYGEDNSMLSMSFSFNKIQNPITNNDFVLSRSNIYRSTYYKAVDSWRQGRVVIQN